MAVPEAQALTWRWAAAAPAEDLLEAVEQLDGMELPAVDPAGVSPAGFDPLEGRTGAPVGRLRAARGGEVRVTDEGGDVVATLRPADGLVRGDLDALRGFRHLRAAVHDLAGPVQLAVLLRQLAVAGVPVLTGPLPLPVARLVGPSTASCLQELTAHTTGDPLLRESWSVSVRRSAMLEVAGAEPVAAVSVVATAASTDGRERLDAQLRRQTHQPVEVLHSPVEGRAEAVARCSGQWVAMVDEGLWYGPDHLRDLLLAARYSGAEVVGCEPRLVYLPELDLTVRLPGGAAERPSRDLHPATVLASLEAAAVLAAGEAPRSAYATHHLGVLRTEVGGERRERSLQRAVGQWPGPPPVPHLGLTAPHWSPPGRARGLRSPFDSAVSQPTPPVNRRTAPAAG